MPPGGRLERKVAVVAGATSGFGEAIAPPVSRPKARRLILSGRRADAGDSIVV
jgi:NADP-dependent 3-hydroxy acid dehydrogenase YdfG